MREIGLLKSLDLSNKKDLVTSKLTNISTTRVCELIGFNRSNLYYEKKPIKEEILNVMNKIDEIYTNISSTYGYRFMHRQLIEDGYAIGVNRVHKLMRQMGIQAIFPKRKYKSGKNTHHKIYPYLLDNTQIDKPNDVWCGDITYIPIKGGHVYLAAILDWHSRTVLSWKISPVMDATLTTDVLNDAIYKYGTPAIFNSDQGSQYTSIEHTTILKKNNI